MSTKGFFDLRTPQHLWAKLQQDYKKLMQCPDHPYLAFNFFITAEHMLDWLYPDNKNKNENKNRDKRKDVRDESEALKICWDLASGAKHFETRKGDLETRQGHLSVAAMGAARFRPVGFRPPGFRPPNFRPASLIVMLEGEAAKKYGPSITVQELAEKVMEYWLANADLQSNIAVQDGNIHKETSK